MSKILIFLEQSGKNLKRSSLELLTFAKKSGAEAHAVAFGGHVDQFANEVAKYGIKSLHLVKSDALDSYNADLFTAQWLDILKEVSPTVVLASASSLGKDLFPKIAAAVDCAIAVDCVAVEITANGAKVKKPIYSGKSLSTVELAGAPSIVLMRANQLPVESFAEATTVAVKEYPLKNLDLNYIIQNVVKGASEKLDLTEANIIVSGGRGLKEAGNFKLLNDLADVLGATVGASRAVVDAGWVSHQMQVGQTGKTVAPTLYIAIGISGAIQHLAGMSGSKVIVAINNDPNAPIFQKSTYGIVGDLFDVVPKLTEEFKKALHK